ncbi:MAG: nucleotide exchange factor GrpE [Pseudomonadota bacterium]
MTNTSENQKPAEAAEDQGQPAPEVAAETGKPAGHPAGADTAADGAAGPQAGAPLEEPVAGPSVEDIVPGLGEAIADEKQARIDELEAERDALKDRLLRALAEAENVRRRAERDRKDAEAFGGTRLARDLLAVYDALDRAVALADDTLREGHGAYVEGVELTRKALLDAFAKHKIEKVEPETGEKFDPNRHEAMFEAPIPGAEPGSVIEVMEAGFTIAGRILRGARVGVARAVPGAAPAAKPDTTTPPEGDADKKAG